MTDNMTAIAPLSADEICRASSDPLFIQDFFLRTGHIAEQAHGTGTFIKFRGRIFICTCRHVLDEAKAGATLAVVAKGMVLNFSSFVPGGIETSFSGVGQFVDIAISLVPIGTWEFLKLEKISRLSTSMISSLPT